MYNEPMRVILGASSLKAYVTAPKTMQVLGIVREHATEQGLQRLLCVFNFSDSAASLALPLEWTSAQPLPGSGLSGAQRQADTLHFEPWGGLFLQA